MSSPATGNAFQKLVLVYTLWLLAWMLASALFEVYFFNMGMSPQDIYLANAFWFVAGILIVPLFRGFRARDFMLAGIAIAMLAVSIMLLFPVELSAYAYRIILGATHLFFWVPFNILFYEFRKENHATLGALYYSVGPVLSLFGPALAGYIAAYSGFSDLFAVAIAIFAAAFAAAFFFIENREYRYDFRASMESISGLRSLIFMEGFAAAVIVSVTLEVMLLSYVDTPLGFGAFISLVTIFSVIAAILTAKLSDRVKKRRAFLLPVVALFALATILASFAPDIAVFFIGFGLISFFSRIFFPLPLALAVDNTKSLTETMVGREWMLNVGRLAGALAGYLLFLATDIRTVLLLQGISLLLYIPLFENRKRKLAKH
jgi:MFS family permease